MSFSKNYCSSLRLNRGQGSALDRQRNTREGATVVNAPPLTEQDVSPSHATGHFSILLRTRSVTSVNLYGVGMLEKK